MRIVPIVLTVALLMVIGTLMQACIPGIKSVKPPGESGQSSPQATPGPSAAPSGPEKGKTDKAAPAGPEYKPPAPPSEKPALSTTELREKEAINEAALKFAKNFQGVEHIKTCYSKLYGGWYVFYYLKKGKKISVEQYSWNPKTEEWEIIYHLKELPADRLEYHLKGEVDDEKCFVLK